AAFYEVAVVFQTPGVRSRFRIFNCTRQEPKRASRDFERYIARERHLTRVAEQAEASHVRAAVDPELEHCSADVPIEGQHLLYRTLHMGSFRKTLLESSRDDTGTDSFRKNERVAGLCASVGQNTFGMDQAGDG